MAPETALHENATVVEVPVEPSVGDESVGAAGAAAQVVKILSVHVVDPPPLKAVTPQLYWVLFARPLMTRKVSGILSARVLPV